MTRALSVAGVVEVPITSIVVGPRRREKLGRIQALVRSIKAHGLIHPIVLRGAMLVAGRRRLEACRTLGWKAIPARQADRLSDEDLRSIELDENTARENLSDYETSKARLAQIRQAEAELKAKAKEQPFSVASRDNNSHPSKRGKGRPKGRTPGSKRDIAAALDTTKEDVTRVEQHVDLAERYPFMQRPGWKRHHVLDAGEALDKLPAADRAPIAALLDQVAIPPASVIDYLAHAATMSVAQRRDVIRLAVSADEFERRSALTAIAQVPPPADPGLLVLVEIAYQGRRAVKLCRAECFKAEVVALSILATKLADKYDDYEKERRDGKTV